jgi:Cdc6-like AAA superfamily ATPase
VRDTIPILQGDIAILRTTQNLQWHAQQLQQHHAILEWLSPLEFGAQQHDIISRKQEGTGQWFLDSSEFKGWLEGNNKTLFCPGIPGAGKTMMAAIAIDRLCQIAPIENIGVAFVYCNYKLQSDQSVNALLSAILTQLVQGRPSIAEPLLELYNRHSPKKTRPSLDEILTALQSTCTKYSRVHLVIDALDECTNQEGARGQLLTKLRELQHSLDIRLMVTARFIPDIEQQFQLASKLELRASVGDVKSYVAGRIVQMHDVPECVKRSNELQTTIEQVISNAVDGM